MDLDAIIAKNLRERHEKEQAERERSGKLSASRLYKPLLEQVLYLIGVPEKPIDDYTLRLFERGKQVEDWVVNMLPDGAEQEEVEYRNCIGYIDKMLDHPIEVKSVKSTQWRWLEKDGAKWSHKLQGGLYALGKASDKYTIAYVVADDFRTFTYTGRTEDIKSDIDAIISEVGNQLKTGRLPEFKPREDWQAKPEYQKYSGYPEFVHLTPDLATKKLKATYPNAYEKLINFKEGK